jgi:peptidoglycan hydrolase CwlO-like protein
VAQTEYGQALAKLNSARGALESLGSRVQSSEKAAKALVADLERLPSKEAQRLRSEAAAVANSVAAQRAAVDRALQRALKDL